MKHNTFNIDGFEVGGNSTFVIAEIGNNHNGSIELAKRLIDAATQAGADAVKFQIRDFGTLYRKRAEGVQAEDLGVEYVQDLLKKVELSLDDHRALRAYCKDIGVRYMCTPWDEASVDVLRTFDIAATKIASADLSNPYLIRYAASLGKPMILSTGMSYEHEIVRAIKVLNELDVPYALLHCNSAYPAPDDDIQLGYLNRLRELHPIVGYSGHERGTAITLASIALGARVVERHITLDREMEGPDHLASLEPEEFRELVDGIRRIERALVWSGNERRVSQGELLNRENLAKSIVTRRAIAKGERLSADDLVIASPGQGLPPYRLEEVIGKTAQRDFAIGDFVFESDLHTQVQARREYAFPIKWGVPVRYHDFRQYTAAIQPDLYEFHLSYRDLSVDPAPMLDRSDCTRLVIHAPELFENSELLDLASDDAAYRARSIENLRRVVEVSHRIGEWFPKADSILIVANVGGFSADEPFPLSHRDELYARVAQACKEIDFGRTELLPQNMAPLPWHFGGQRHQNIFMMPEEIAQQCAKTGTRICLDLSHLSMMCHHFSIDFQASLELLLPYARHLHIADALGANGEGVLLGTGDIDWAAAWESVCATEGCSFIPEVWQGHKDHGAGFWSALDFLARLPHGCLTE